MGKTIRPDIRRLLRKISMTVTNLVAAAAPYERQATFSQPAIAGDDRQSADFPGTTQL
jgi:hypothetical protein